MRMLAFRCTHSVHLTNTSQEQARFWALTVRGTDCHSVCPQDPQGLPRTPGFPGHQPGGGEGRVIRLHGGQGGPHGAGGGFPSPRAQGLLTLVFLSAQRRAALQAWRWSAVPTAAPAAAQTSRRGSCVRRTRPASRAAAVPRVGAPFRHGGAAQGEGRGGPWGVGISSGGPPPAGSLEQDGGCVPLGHCECTDAQGHSWAPGSQHQEACNNCTCRAGQLSCTAQPCPPPAHCAWSRWSAWSPCSRSCGPAGQQSRFRYGAGPACVTSLHRGLPQPGRGLLDCRGSWILSPPVTLCHPVTWPWLWSLVIPAFP